MTTTEENYSADLTDNTKWSLTVNAVNGDGDYVCWLEVKKTWTDKKETVYRYLQYNATNTRFASYKDTQEDPLIYKKAAAASCTGDADMSSSAASLKGSISLNHLLRTCSLPEGYLKGTYPAPPYIYYVYIP